MKTMLTILLSFFIVSFASAQRIIVEHFNTTRNLINPENAIGEIVYELQHVKDTTRPDSVYKEIFVLDFSKNYGRFYSKSYLDSDSIMTATLNMQVQGVNPSQINDQTFDLSGLTIKGNNDEFLCDLSKNITILEESIIDNLYLITDSISLINWQIEDSAKQIGAYTCQKATGKSHGRQYIVWFTTDIPYSFGPRRLFGLPGLILEAYDTSHRISYFFKKIITPVSNLKVGIPSQGIFTTQKEYDRMNQTFADDPAALIRASTGYNVKNSDIHMTSQKVNTVKKKQTSKFENNFPIELN